MKVELLAPIGSFSMVEAILNTECDAVYLGGKELNMRMHSKLHNFSNDEIKTTVEMAHKLGKKVYVTVNIMFDDTMIEMASEYLRFLKNINVNALIVQDLGMIQLIHDLHLDLEIHASVMANTHTLEQVKVLEELGVSRVVLTREVSLKTAKYISENTKVELEYFVADNMCPANSAICYFSGVLFGKSSNQGKCMKMCRWNYEMVYKNESYGNSYYLAAKDIDMVNHLEDMIDAGIVSLKIEGRRKPLDETLGLINGYVKALENYNNKIKEEIDLSDYYRRDRCTGHAYSNPQVKLNNLKNEGREDVIRMFSKKGKDMKVTPLKTEKLEKIIQNNAPNKSITVKVDNYQDALFALNYDIDKIYISLESVTNPFNIKQVQDIIDRKKDKKIYVSMTTMQFPDGNKYRDAILSQVSGLDGIEATDVSHITKYKDEYEVRSHYTLGQLNTKAAKLLTNLGASSTSISIEVKPNQFNDLLNSSYDVDILGYGRLVYMYMDVNFYNYLTNLKPITTTNSLFEDQLVMRNATGGENPIYRDQFDKNFLTSEKIVNLSKVVKSGNIIIDARFISREELQRGIDLYTGKVIAEMNSNEYYGTLNHVYEQQQFILHQDADR